VPNQLYFRAYLWRTSEGRLGVWPPGHGSHILERDEVGEYRDSLVPPFTIRRTRFRTATNSESSERDSGPYPSLHRAHQVLLRRKRENGAFWVEDDHGQRVDFDRLNRESRNA
jgi:hypothetical protein